MGLKETGIFVGTSILLIWIIIWVLLERQLLIAALIHLWSKRYHSLRISVMCVIASCTWCQTEFWNSLPYVSLIHVVLIFSEFGWTLFKLTSSTNKQIRFDWRLESAATFPCKTLFSHRRADIETHIIAIYTIMNECLPWTCDRHESLLRRCVYMQA